MSGVDTRFITKRKQHVANRRDQRRVVAPRQVGSTDRTRKEGVADEQIEPALTSPRHLDADASGAMSWRVMNACLEVTERNPLLDAVEAVNRRRRIDGQAEQTSLHDGLLVQEEIVSVQMHWCAEGAPGRCDSGDVVDMRVRQQDVRNRDPLLSDELEEPVDFVAWIDQHTGARSRTGNHESVLVKRRDGLRLDYDHFVILAILDDLMFTSKIRSAAQHASVTVTFARSAASALEQMQMTIPTLVLLDLNNPRTDPLGVISTMTADARLAQVPTVGFVSHVDAATIDAARAAGIGTVLARSAFVAQLPGLLAAAGPRA